MQPSPEEVEEAARLSAMGLREYSVAGTPYKLVGMAVEGKEPPTLAQRVEMARRLNEVGPKLPHYFKVHLKEDKPAATVEAVLSAAKGEGKMQAKTAASPAAPAAALDTKEIERAHALSVKDAAKREAQKKLDEAKKAKVDELKRKQTAAARKKVKGSSVAPKRTPAERKEADAKAAKAPKAKAAPAAAAPKKKGGIGGFCERLLVEGKSNEDILKAVKKEYPSAKTSAASLAWYRSRLREEGKLPPA